MKKNGHMQTRFTIFLNVDSIMVGAKKSFKILEFLKHLFQHSSPVFSLCYYLWLLLLRRRRKKEKEFFYFYSKQGRGSCLPVPTSWFQRLCCNQEFCLLLNMSWNYLITEMYWVISISSAHYLQGNRQSKNFFFSITTCDICHTLSQLSISELLSELLLVSELLLEPN